MAQLSRSTASLRIIGDDLAPSEITGLIGKAPNKAKKKGDVFETPNGQSVISRTGSWSIEVDDAIPADVDKQVIELLENTIQNTEVWHGLSKRFRVEIFCGLFLEDGNQGLNISTETLMILGLRGIALELDIYNVD